MTRPCSSSGLSCAERLHLRCDGKAGNSFPTTQGNDPSSRAMRWKRGSSGCGRDYLASSRVETGMSGNCLSCSKGVKTLWKFQKLGVISLEMPQRKWASSRLEGRTSWIFSSCGRCSRLTMGTSGSLSGGLKYSRSNPRSMSALERNPQVPAETPHKVLGPDIDGRGIPRGPRATRMGRDLN